MMITLDTFMGHRVDFAQFDHEKIEIRDIGHALSNLCRFGGHCNRFYSVAEHSLHCLYLARQEGYSLEIQKWALLHDASEAYCVDIPRGLKNLLPEYKTIEETVQRAIAQKFNLCWPIPPEINEIDNGVLKWEKDLLGFKAQDWKLETSLTYRRNDRFLLSATASDFEYQYLILFGTL